MFKKGKCIWCGWIKYVNKYNICPDCVLGVKSSKYCDDCIHYKNNDCGNYKHPCPEIINPENSANAKTNTR